MLLSGLAYARDELDRSELHRMLDELLDLREHTDPKIGNPPDAISFRGVNGKNAAAERAILLGSSLLQASAGWALNHLIGRALSTAVGRSLDSHELELEGCAEYSGINGLDRPSDKATLDRTVLVALLRDGFDQPLFPPNLAMELKGALRALDFGETWPLVNPIKRGLHGNAFTLAQYRLAAIEYLYFLVGQGIKKHVAATSVSALFGVSTETVRSWESRELLRVFSKDNISEVINTAKQAGALFAIRRDDPDYATEGRTETIKANVYHVFRKFSEGNINRIVAAYKVALTKP